VRRVVLDLNVVISALIEGRGPSATVVRAVLEGRLQAVACPRWFAELAQVTERPKFAGRFSRPQASAVIDALLTRVELREDPHAPMAYTPDRDDDYLVALALEAGCEAIVSGDPHLSDQNVLAVLAPRTLADELDAAE